MFFKIVIRYDSRAVVTWKIDAVTKTKIEPEIPEYTRSLAVSSPISSKRLSRTSMMRMPLHKTKDATVLRFTIKWDFK